MGVKFILCLNKQGKVRLSKFYTNYKINEEDEIIKLVYKTINNNNKFNQNNSNHNCIEFIDNCKLIYKKYNGLNFIICINDDDDDNQLMYLNSIPIYVKLLDEHFNNVSELDLIFNFYKMETILDEMFINGELINI